MQLHLPIFPPVPEGSTRPGVYQRGLVGGPGQSAQTETRCKSISPVKAPAGGRHVTRILAVGRSAVTFTPQTRRGEAGTVCPAAAQTLRV